ncbi:MAG TPA: hypothetical protein VMQ93_07240 [Novosphingobium sp.]|nr:hypothetical protein [Novosphingobium sp.]
MKAAAMERLSVASRVVAGTLGAYALTAVLTAALSLLLVQMGIDRVEAATGATIASFALFAIAAMAVFHARSVTRAWIWLVAIAAPCALVVMLLRVAA